MSSEDELREAETKIKAAEPSPGLRNQIPADEEILWVTRQDLRTCWFNLILHKLKLSMVMLVFGFAAGIFTVAYTGSGLLGFLAFLVVGIGIPVGYFASQYYVLKNTNIEYAATTDHFIEYRDTPTETRSHSVPIERAKNASFSQDRWDKLLDTGNIHIQAVRGTQNLLVKDVPKADAVHRLIQAQIADADQVDNVGRLQENTIRR